MSDITLKNLINAGVHFGHQTQRWNPKMKPYVYTERSGIHIIDLQKSLVCAKRAIKFMKDTAASGGRVIFVGTKKQAIEPVREAATRCGQYWVTKRWLGGMLTNFTTIKSSIDYLKKIDRMREKGELDFFSKKERVRIEKEYKKLSEYLDGIREMKESPAALFVVDLNKEHIAIAEAKRLGIKVVGIADTNSDPYAIDYPIPGNDDAIRSIRLFSDMVATAYLEGAKEWELKKKSIEVEAPEKEEAVKREVKPNTSGPQVVKVAKSRKFVAAGMAEDVEIKEELERQQDKPAEDGEPIEIMASTTESKESQATKDSALQGETPSKEDTPSTK